MAAGAWASGTEVATEVTAPEPAAAAVPADTSDAMLEARQLMADARRADRAARKQAEQVEAQAVSQAAAAAQAEAVAAVRIPTQATPARVERPRQQYAQGGNRSRSAPSRVDQPVVTGSGSTDPVVGFALAQVGKGYRYASNGPDAFDCSGLVSAAYGQIGVGLPHQTGSLSGKGTSVGRGDLRPGDLVFTDPGHVGIYVGNNQMVHATTPGGGVKRADVYRFAYGRRIVG